MRGDYEYERERERDRERAGKILFIQKTWVTYIGLYELGRVERVLKISTRDIHLLGFFLLIIIYNIHIIQFWWVRLSQIM
jgi:hypothetical protein